MLLYTQRRAGGEFNRVFSAAYVLHTPLRLGVMDVAILRLVRASSLIGSGPHIIWSHAVNELHRQPP